MTAQPLTRVAGICLLLAGAACARNKADNQVGAAQDSTITAKVDSNQTESGVTDSTGKSTLGKDVEKTRPDQGQPVTSKGDTINPGVDSTSAGAPQQPQGAYDSTAGGVGVDSSAAGAGMDTTTRTGIDTTSPTSGADSTAGAGMDSTVNQTESGVTDSSGASTLPGADQTRPDQGQPVTSKGDTLNPGVDSSTTQR